MDRYSAEIEQGERLFNWFSEVLLNLPDHIQYHFQDQNWCVAIPVFIQHRIILYSMSMPRWNTWPQTTLNDSKNPTRLTTLYGFKVVDGYEMAAVIFNPDFACIDPRAVHKVNIEYPPLS